MRYHVSITHDALYLTIEGSPLLYGALDPPPDFFELGKLGPHCSLTVQGHPPGMFQPIYYEAHTVGIRAAGILLECFLVKLQSQILSFIESTSFYYILNVTDFLLFYYSTNTK